MAPVRVLDSYYLGITGVITVGYQLAGFVIAWTFQFDKITDFTGGSNFFLLALLTLSFGNTFHTRNIVASVLVMIWATRTAGFLLFRVLKRGSDARFDEIRSQFFMFLGFWVVQMFWVWTVSLPLTVLNSPAVSDINPHFGTSRDIAGLVLWTVGWVIETIADAEKFRYTSSMPPKDKPITKGVWGWSRHPSYFGEILCWWGIWILCLSPSTNGDLPSSAKSAQYGSIMSPIFTVLILMFATGVPTAEKPQARRFYLLSHGPEVDGRFANAWKNYKIYLTRTSILIPIPPVVYVRLPVWLKKSLLLDFPMYHFDEGRDGREAVDEATKATLK